MCDKNEISKAAPAPAKSLNQSPPEAQSESPRSELQSHIPVRKCVRRKKKLGKRQRRIKRRVPKRKGLIYPPRIRYRKNKRNVDEQEEEMLGEGAERNSKEAQDSQIVEEFGENQPQMDAGFAPKAKAKKNRNKQKRKAIKKPKNGQAKRKGRCVAKYDSLENIPSSLKLLLKDSQHHDSQTSNVSSLSSVDSYAALPSELKKLLKVDPMEEEEDCGCESECEDL